MNFNMLLEIWAFWMINGGVVCAREIAQWDEAENVQAGECSKCAVGSPPLMINPAMDTLKYLYATELTPIEQKVIAVEFGINGLVSNKLRGRASYLDITPAKYSKHLFNAKRKLNIKIGCRNNKKAEIIFI